MPDLTPRRFPIHFPVREAATGVQDEDRKVGPLELPSGQGRSETEVRVGS